MELKPTYGTRYHVTPKHWWRPSHRKAARVAAALLDAQAAPEPGQAIYYNGRKIKPPTWPISTPSGA